MIMLMCRRLSRRSFAKADAYVLMFLGIIALSFLPKNSLGEVKFKLPWDRLKQYHDTLTEEEFRTAVDLYSPDGSLYTYLTLTHSYVDIFRDRGKAKPPLLRLYLAKNPASKKTIQKPLRCFPSPSQPLNGLRILLDPGHIGGRFAEMEQRILKRQDGSYIQEAQINLKVALLLKKRLQELGSKVYLTKEDLEPVAKADPKNFKDPVLFYRVSEIQTRAELAKKIRPDLTLCLHFNAAPAPMENPWVEDNRLVIFIHGCYEAEELIQEEQRLRLISKLLEGSHKTELELAEAIASEMGRQTGLPPVEYTPSPKYVKVGRSPYLYARNFLANRLYPGPVIYLEPYYQNNPLVYERLLAGDYEGERIVQGKSRKSIFREYADSVTDGIVNYFVVSREFGVGSSEFE